MSRDLKIGMFIGVVLVASATIWLSTRKSLSIQSRFLSSQHTIESEEGLAPVQDQNPDKPKDNSEFQEQEKIKTTRFHVVRKGETLSDISRRYYQSGNELKKILKANSIDNPDNIKAGMKLVIPE